MFLLILHTPVKIACCTALILALIIQIKHIRKTKIKKIGLRIFIVLMSVVLITFVIHVSYGTMKTIQGNFLLDDIQKIEFSNYTLNKNDLENAKLKFVNDATMLSKATNRAVIYYDNGTTEISSVSFNGALICKINEDSYYLQNINILNIR